ncbi:MAG: phosphodiester glycosidase family protein [Armatimonadota bacterium]
MTAADSHRAIIAAVLALALAAAGPPVIAAGSAVVVNGNALDPGLAFVAADGHLMLTAEGLRRGLGLTVAREAEGAPWEVRGFGRTVQVRADATAYTVDGDLRRAQRPAVLVEGELAVPLEMIRAAFEISAQVEGDGETALWTLATPGSALTDIRQGSHAESVRLVLDLERPTGFSWQTQPGRLTLEVPAPRKQAGWAQSVRLLRFDDPLITEVRQGPTASGTIRVEIIHNSKLPPAVFSLAEPPRVVVDLFRSPQDIPVPAEPLPVLPLPVSAGILQKRNFTTPRGPVRVYVLDVDPRSEAIDVRPALAASTIHQRESVARIVAACGAWGGVNGGFFASQGPPLGMLVIDGEWIREPWPGRTVLGITADGRLLMDRLTFSARVVFAGLGTQRLWAINRGHDEQDTMVMYTRRWGDVLAGASGRTRLVVDGSGAVTHKETNGCALRIPQDGFVLSGIGRMAASLSMVEVGTMVTAQLGTDPAWPGLRHAIGGGPRLVKDGRPHITAGPEHFRADVCASIRPRTAVGFTRAGRLLLVAAEPSDPGTNGGMTLEELASTMIKLGAWQAMNLDGGGSTTFVAGGRVLNSPSDGAARRVSNALLVFTRQVATAAEVGG